VQKVAEARKGYMPLFAMRVNNARFSSQFDDQSVFELHCRGQGPRYNHSNGALAFGAGVSSDDVMHYNFSGFFAGMCCFCARHSGFGTELFICSGCNNCVRKDILRSACVRLFRNKQDGDVSWEDNGWRALPSVLVDYIISFVVGIHGVWQRTSIVDGNVIMPASGEAAM